MTYYTKNLVSVPVKGDDSYEENTYKWVIKEVFEE